MWIPVWYVLCVLVGVLWTGQGGRGGMVRYTVEPSRDSEAGSISFWLESSP